MLLTILKAAAEKRRNKCNNKNIWRLLKVLKSLPNRFHPLIGLNIALVESWETFSLSNIADLHLPPAAVNLANGQ